MSSPIEVVNMSPEDYRKRKVALITGITGQDGSYLAELLIEKGYQVHGIIRRSSSFNTGRIEHLYKDAHENPKMRLHHGDLTDSTCLVHIISKVLPSEIYNLGAQSHVKVSFDMSEYTADVDAVGTLRLLDAIRTCGLAHLVRFYQAYNMYACNGILFNHESPRRGRTFVTRKITCAVAAIHLGKQECLYLGNLDAKRDWGHARDYVEGMWRMLQQETADDFVLATGEMHTVREFVEKSFKATGSSIRWEGSAEEEVGIDEKGVIRVRVDPAYYRPTEVELLLGNPAKANEKLGWKRQVEFDALVEEMVKSDLIGVAAGDVFN
ncbi:hypothetical protein BGZ70_007110 [Mortierella alpina]|uniref:GDP-mannose 4,6-dehydratase n=1 Tax=Mortierella alpina TaxID=64518 RepID=A0A9P6M394_MORAP|nr:hypothetical protein BGZ70_007110 [Mortierella alpina]